MADLIDRAALLERIDAKFFATDPKGEEQLGYLNSRTLVRTAPAVDAVEVVRCKDCKRNEKKWRRLQQDTDYHRKRLCA
mgnify:CR=1 FL=1